MNMIDFVLFAAFPYVAILFAIVMGIYRWFTNRFTYSSLSSQFLENRQLFWGSVAWHYAIIIILLAHIIALLFPRLWALVIANPTRLYTLEIIGFALGMMAIVSLTWLIIRRYLYSRVRAVTTVMDSVLLAVLIAQIVLGFYVALFYRWGSDWYLYTAVPWLVSIVKLNPQIQYVTDLSWIVKLHFLGAFVLITLLPFTRLVHVVVVPIPYLWRPYQVFIWNHWKRRGLIDRCLNYFSFISYRRPRAAGGEK